MQEAIAADGAGLRPPDACWPWRHSATNYVVVAGDVAVGVPAVDVAVVGVDDDGLVAGNESAAVVAGRRRGPSAANAERRFGLG